MINNESCIINVLRNIYNLLGLLWIENSMNSQHFAFASFTRHIPHLFIYLIITWRRGCVWMQRWSTTTRCTSATICSGSSTSSDRLALCSLNRHIQEQQQQRDRQKQRVPQQQRDVEAAARSSSGCIASVCSICSWSCARAHRSPSFSTCALNATAFSTSSETLLVLFPSYFSFFYH